MKILHLCVHSQNHFGASFHNTDHRLSRGFTRNGHYVYDLSLRDIARNKSFFGSKKTGLAHANQTVLKVADNLRPDLILIGHIDFITPQTFETLRQRYPGIKMAMWYVDHLVNNPRSQFIHGYAPYLDAFFATTGGPLLNQFGQHMHRAFFPNPVDAAIDTHQAFNIEHPRHDFVFFGTVGDDLPRKQLLDFLTSDLRDLRTYFGGVTDPTAGGSHYLDILGHSAISLNFSRHNDVPLYTSDRLAHVTGNGILALSPEVPDLQQLYQPDEIGYYRTPEELSSLIKYYAAHPAERMQLAARGWKKAHSSYHSTRVAKFMEDVIMERGLSEAYEWRNHVFEAVRQ